MDRFSSTCLLICVLLLSVIAFRPIVTPPSAHAANQYEYLVVTTRAVGSDVVQRDIDEQANDGWEFVSSIVTATAQQPLLVFRKER
jgi:hypothetical protein